MADNPIQLLAAVQLHAITTNAVSQNGSQLPPEIAKLSAGTMLSGFVITRDKENNPILRTDKGDFGVKSEVFLKTGSEVVIRIEASRLGSKARILTVDGITIEQLAEQQQNKNVSRDTVSTSSLVAKDVAVAMKASTMQAANQSLLQAVVLSSGKPTPASFSPEKLIPIVISPQADAPVLKPGTVLQIRILETNLAAPPSYASLGAKSTPLQAPPIPTATQFYGAYQKLASTTTQPDTTQAKQPNVLLPNQSTPVNLQTLLNAQQLPSTLEVAANLTQAEDPAFSTPLSLSSTATHANAAATQQAKITTANQIIQNTIQTITQTAQGNLAGNISVDTTTEKTPFVIPTATTAAPAAATPTIANSAPLSSTPVPTANSAVATAVPAIATAPHISTLATSSTTNPALASQTQPAPQPQATQQPTQALQTFTTAPPAENKPILYTPLQTTAPLPTATAQPQTLTLTSTSTSPPTPNAPQEILQTQAAPLPQTKPLATIPTNPNALVVEARVIGTEGDGEAIVQTSIGTLKIFTPTPLPTGSRLMLEVITVTSESPSHTNVGTITATATQIQEAPETVDHRRNFDAFKSLVDWVQTQPLDTQNALQNVMPNFKGKFTAPLLFLLSALKGGDIRQWLGHKLSEDLALRAPDLLRQAMGEFDSMRPQAKPSTDQTWQVIPLPIQAEGEKQARLLVRHWDEDEEEKVGNATGERFVVDLNLTQLGAMQLDGFLREWGTSKALDLAVRTTKALPSHMQKDIEQLFADATKATGIGGNVYFQVAPDAFVRVEETATPRPPSDRSIIA